MHTHLHHMQTHIPNEKTQKDRDTERKTQERDRGRDHKKSHTTHLPPGKDKREPNVLEKSG